MGRRECVSVCVDERVRGCVSVWAISLSPVRRKMCERVWVEESVLVYVWMRG